MNKNYLRTFKILLPTFLTICLVSFLWPKIKLPYANPEEIIGILSIFKQSSFNDSIRYLVFILLPLLTYLFFYINENKSKCVKLNNIFILSNKNKKIEYLPLIYLLIVIILILLRYLSSDFNINKMDLFHEGQHLSGAINYELTGNFWLNSFSVTSLFTDFLNAKIAWFIHGVKSISAYRHLLMCYI